MATFYDARHISTSRDYQPQETQWFEIAVEGIEDLTFVTMSCNLPERSNRALEIPYGNSTAYVAGKVEYATNTFTFMDAMKKDIEGQILDWQNIIQNQDDGRMGWVDEYKRNIKVTEYGPNGSRKRTTTFHGAFPESVNYGQMNHDSPGRKDIQVTIRFDYATRDEVTPDEDSDWIR